jgi:DNA (cytosine-5)-methyltransferase 1
LAELTCLEICAGGGGQSLGLELAGFTHDAALELDPSACATLRANRGSEWKIIEDDVRNLDGRAFAGIDLISGGVPCPPFSIAGKQLGSDDERDLFPQALRLVEQASPRAVLLENVRGLATARLLAEARSTAGLTWVQPGLGRRGSCSASMALASRTSRRVPISRPISHPS